MSGGVEEPRTPVGRPEVVILVGLQGAGKSTFYQQRFATSHALVSRDQFRNNPRPARRQAVLLAEALAQGRSVVVDNTSPTPADRAAVVDVARRFGAPVACYFFRSDVRGAIARNARREGQSRVPVVAILAAAKRMVPPSRGEGFDRLYVVETAPDGSFLVEERDPAEASAVDAPARRP